MSFSSDIKEELSKINNLTKKNEIKYELLGYFISKNTNVINSKLIRYTTESEYNINRFSKLLKNLDINHNIGIEGKIFVITFRKKEIVNKEKQNFLNENNNNKDYKEERENIKIKSFDNLIKFESEDILVSEQCKELNDFEKKALIRGAFLGAGSINNPENKYHLEIKLSNLENLYHIENILKEFNINTKILEQENKHSIYLKEGEEIANFLALLGANRAVLQFEDVRVKKGMRCKVNRIVNCQTANLNKTINASVEQIEAIKKLQRENKFSKLDDNLKEIALLRLENPDVSLEELGKKLDTPLGKSGVNYRLKKIIEFAKD